MFAEVFCDLPQFGDEKQKFWEQQLVLWVVMFQFQAQRMKQFSLNLLYFLRIF